jgi:hypothetical protein
MFLGKFGLAKRIHMRFRPGVIPVIGFGFASPVSLFMKFSMTDVSCHGQQDGSFRCR